MGTWGAPAEYYPEDVCSGASRIPCAVESKVAVAPAPQESDQTMVGSTVTIDEQHFPALSTLSRIPKEVVWGPRDSQGNQDCSLSKQLSADKIRNGSTELFDSQRPRNQFARK